MLSMAEWGLFALIAIGLIIPFVFIIRIAMSPPPEETKGE